MWSSRLARRALDLVSLFNNDSLVIDLPPGETTDDYRAVSVWCTAAGANFGSGEFESVFTMDPGPLRAGIVSKFRYEGATPYQPIRRLLNSARLTLVVMRTVQ